VASDHHSPLSKLLIILCISFLLVNVVWSVKNVQSTPDDIAKRASSYPLLAKRIFMDNPNDILINFVPLRKSLEQRFTELQGVKYSFYFEYLPDGTAIRQGADQQLVAASLIKVPLVMNLYRAAELGRIDLDKSVTITKEELDDAYGTLWQKGAGTTLTLRRAAQYTLEDSDNTASHLIFDHMQGVLAYEDQSLARLDVDQNLEDGQAVITARSYSSVLKSLYFASYLDKTHSQELLGYLAQSTATNRLTKHLPKGIKVAHKIGVYNTSWAESDCGVIYLPNRPYIVCVMVGLPEDQADAFIAEVSREIYAFVSSAH
jgi:beta-lactamase class A